MCLNRKYPLTVSSKSLRREELVQRYVGPLYLMMTNFVWPIKMKQLDLPIQNVNAFLENQFILKCNKS